MSERTIKRIAVLKTQGVEVVSKLVSECMIDLIVGEVRVIFRSECVRGGCLSLEDSEFNKLGDWTKISISLFLYNFSPYFILLVC